MTWLTVTCKLESRVTCLQPSRYISTSNHGAFSHDVTSAHPTGVMKQWNGAMLVSSLMGVVPCSFVKNHLLLVTTRDAINYTSLLLQKKAVTWWEFNSHRTCLRHQNGRPSQHGGRDAMWKSSIHWIRVILLSRNRVRWHMSAWKLTQATQLPRDCSYALDLRSSDLLPLNHLYMALFDVFLCFRQQASFFQIQNEKGWVSSCPKELSCRWWLIFITLSMRRAYVSH